jgi:hypothetical protein
MLALCYCSSLAACIRNAELCNETVQLTYRQVDMRMVIMFRVLVELLCKYCNMSMEGLETNTCSLVGDCH